MCRALSTQLKATVILLCFQTVRWVMEAINNGRQTLQTRERSKTLPSHLHHCISRSVGARASSTLEMLLHLTQQSPPPQPVVSNALVLQLGRAFNCDSTAVGILFDCTSTRYDYSTTHFTTLGTMGLEYLFVGLPVSVFRLFHRGLIK